MIERHLSIKDIMVALGIGRSRAYEVAHDMPHVRIGRSVRVSEAVFSQYLKQRTVQPLARAPIMSRTAEAAWAARVRKQTKLRAGAVRAGALVGDGSTIRLTRPRT